MDIERDLERIRLQEQKLHFAHFDAAVAWTLGNALKAAAEARGKAVSIDIRLHGQHLFFYAMPGTTPDNADWIRRKCNVVQRYQRSSYGVGLTLQRDNTSLQAKNGADLKDYATHGGGFPIWLAGVCIGSITVSGLPQREDHELVVAVLADHLSVPVAEIALES
jgi:uncharacterized protein (UPF0303 family)